MLVYFVRHGQSVGNAAKLHQERGCELSPEGLRQADQLAQRFESITVDYLVSSPIKRALQTAQKVSAVTGIPVALDARLEEFRRPSFVVGKSTSDPDVIKLWNKLNAHETEHDYHFSDEENFFDVKKRISSFIKDLVNREELNIVVASHGLALRMVFGLMIFGDDLSVTEYRSIVGHLQTSNTGVTICEYEKASGWRILTLNDHAHLLE